MSSTRIFSRPNLLAAVAVASLLAASAGEAQELALKRVLISSGGLGYYEYEADVEGDATVSLTVRLDQVDDVLKSLVVFDDKGGIGGLDLASQEPLVESFRSLPFSADDLKSTPDLLAALRGAEVEVGGPRSISGRIVSVSEETATTRDGTQISQRHRISLMTDKGLEQFILEDADSLKFSDPAVQAQLEKALKAIASNSEKDARTLRLVSMGKEKRKLRVGYLVSAPLWKVSYRLVLSGAPDAKNATLQGWATLENLSGQDWKDVDLTLVSGRPVTFRQELYRSYMVDRPEAPVEVGGKLAPGVDEGGVARGAEPEAEPTPAAGLPRKAMMMAPAAHAFAGVGSGNAAPAPMPTSMSFAAAAETVAAEQGLTQVSFHIPFPVSVGAGRTLSLPVVDGPEPAARVAFYDPSVDSRHPLSAVELANGGNSDLPPGIVTTYEEGDSGVAYVGDSRLSDLPAGDKRLLSYALDQKTLIEASAADATSLTRATIAKGMLNVETLDRHKVTYRVKASEPRRLVVAAPKLAGWKLTEPGNAAVTESEGRYRVPFDVNAGDGETFVVTQERTETRIFALASIDDANLGFYLKAREIDAATQAQLATLGDLRGKHAAAEHALSEVSGQIDEVVADQTRLKNLLPVVAAGSDLQKRYLAKLDQDETALDQLKATRATRQKARDEAKKAVEDFIAGL